MSNYYVRRTGDDSDYLEHAIFQRGVRGNHKYIARFNIGGKMRYIYDPRELAAFKAAQSGLKKAGNAISNVRRAADHAIGFTARRNARKFKEQMNTARRNAGNAVGTKNYKANLAEYRRLKSKYNTANKYYNNRTLLGRIGNMPGMARKAVGDAADAARRAGKSFAGTVSKTAYNARTRAGKAIDTYVTGSSARRSFNAAAKRYDQQSVNGVAGSAQRASRARRNAAAAEKNYNKSLRGKLNRVFGFEDDLSDVVKRTQTKKRNASKGRRRRRQERQNRTYGRSTQ